MTISAASAAKFVKDVEIFEEVYKGPEGPAEAKPEPNLLKGAFDSAKNQATVAAGDLLSFVNGVTEEGREAIVLSSLLAQLVAKKKVPDLRATDAWYEAYFDALTNLGWVIQSREFADYKQDSQNFETHKAVLAVAATMLGAAPTALAVVTSAINALHSMNQSRPWITVFNRESQSADTGRFQISLVEKGPDAQFLVSMIAFSMKAKSTISQVLFFKASMDEVKLRHDSSKVTIASSAMTGVLPALREKLAKHIGKYVSMAEID